MNYLPTTKLRKNLLAYAFTHADEDYYVRELAVLIGADSGNLSRELRHMAEEGIFNVKSRGRLRLYRLNKDYPLFDQLKKLVSKTVGIAGSLKALINRYPEIAFSCIYGSYAKNAETASSDIDLIVVGKIPLHEFTRRIRALERELNREINFTTYTTAEFNREQAKKGSFLAEVLSGKIIVLKK